MHYTEIVIANNTATSGNGGGISLYRSDIEIRGYCIFSKMKLEGVEKSMPLVQLFLCTVTNIPIIFSSSTVGNKMEVEFI